MSITESDAYDIRYTNERDGGFLEKWLKYPGMSSSYPFTTEQERSFFCRNWMWYVRHKSCLTATYKETPIGMAVLYLMPYKKVAHMGLLSFIVDPHMQRKGVGTSLIRNIKHLGKTNFNLESLHLDVYEKSPAKPFLDEMGFRCIFTQNEFVHDGSAYLKRHLMEAIL